MTVNYTPIIKELAENKNRIGYEISPMGGLYLGVSYEMQERDKVKIGPEVYFSTHSSGMDKKVKIEKQEDPLFLMVVSYPTYRDFFANPKVKTEETSNYIHMEVSD